MGLTNGARNTPLHLAAVKGLADTVRLMTELGADVDAENGNGSTPFHLADSNCRSDAIHVLAQELGDVARLRFP